VEVVASESVNFFLAGIVSLFSVFLLLSSEMSVIKVVRGRNSLTVEREEILECDPELVDDEEVYDEERELREVEYL
jgi:hypothetical protein